MNVFGTTRSRVTEQHALITPDTWVWQDLPGWRGAKGVVHISLAQALPAIGAGGGDFGAVDGGLARWG